GRLGTVQGSPSHWKQFRRDQITALVREIRDAVKAERPPLILSACVIPWGAFPGDFSRTAAYNNVGQDWYGWIRGGLVDAVCPMTYQTSLAGFKGWVDGVRRDHPGFPVWFGIGAYLFNADSAAAKVQAVRRSGGEGWVLFSYTAVTRGGSNDAYLRDLRARVMPPQRASGN
ncbi:MAG TPA: family 10 glycosylhydrolase, partial [Armatimonadota bacterium]|nr:family 10 glycosylhydrolase [Armatimonadota bacterium]